MNIGANLALGWHLDDAILHFLVNGRFLEMALLDDRVTE
jgi:hypothetical protein